MTGKLSVGAIIHSLDGQAIRVQSVEQEAQRQDTYNFEVADYHTYFVGELGTWVHNTCYDNLSKFLGNMGKKEFDRLAARWDKGSFDFSEDSLKHHVKKHGDNMDLAKYLRQADAFSTKGARSTSVDNGGIKYMKNGKYIIMRDGKIVSYGMKDD